MPADKHAGRDTFRIASFPPFCLPKWQRKAKNASVQLA
jgi:hypothetical protein